MLAWPLYTFLQSSLKLFSIIFKKQDKKGKREKGETLLRAPSARRPASEVQTPGLFPLIVEQEKTLYYHEAEPEGAIIRR